MDRQGLFFLIRNNQIPASGQFIQCDAEVVRYPDQDIDIRYCDPSFVSGEGLPFYMQFEGEYVLFQILLSAQSSDVFSDCVSVHGLSRAGEDAGAPRPVRQLFLLPEYICVCLFCGRDICSVRVALQTDRIFLLIF